MQTLVGDLNNEVHVYLLGVEVLHQFIGSFSSTTSSQQIVVDKYYIVFIDRIDMHLDGIDTILL